LVKSTSSLRLCDCRRQSEATLVRALFVQFCVECSPSPDDERWSQMSAARRSVRPSLEHRREHLADERRLFVELLLAD
jgi:hypothetical protein